jgi:hypothetical protein
LNTDYLFLIILLLRYRVFREVSMIKISILVSALAFVLAPALSFAAPPEGLPISVWTVARDHLAEKLKTSKEAVEADYAVTWEYLGGYEDDQPVVVLFQGIPLTCTIEVASVSLEIRNFECRMTY